MYKFQKTRDPENEFDTTNVTIESNAVTMPQLIEDFKDFLAACGFPISHNDNLIIEEEEE
jgi:hypothetical protein